VRTRRRKRRIRLADEEKTRRLIFYILWTSISCHSIL
jgi:hypothetical protein